MYAGPPYDGKMRFFASAPSITKAQQRPPTTLLAMEPIRPISAHSRDRDTFVCPVKFVLQAFTAVPRKEPRRPRKSTPIAITTHALAKSALA